MGSQPTSFPVKARIKTVSSMREISKAPVTNFKSGVTLPREKRVFGTTQNPNIPLKTAPEKPVKEKPQSRLLKKTVKPLLGTQQPTRRRPLLEAKNVPEKNTLRKIEAEKSGKCCSDGNSMEPLTPIRAVQVKTKVVTPYFSAEKCSKCRFDKLETSSYWLGQIKIAESVGKHFVSSTFFGLALECKAEPMKNMSVELKKYVARHDYLRDEEDWNKLLHSYGLICSANEMISYGEEERKDSQIQKSEENFDHLSVI